MIQRLSTRNFRSLERVDRLEFDRKLTALVGPNGSGKSAILRAIDLMFGPTWPSLRSLRVPQDWTNFDTNKELRLRLRLFEPLPYQDKKKTVHEIHGFEITCKPYKRRTRRARPGDPNFDFRVLDARGEIPSVCTAIVKGGASFGPLLGVPAELRDAARVLFIDHRRSIFQQQPWSRGSVLASLLASARVELDQIEFSPGKTHRQAFRERYEQAVEVLRTPTLQEVETVISETARRTLGFLGSRTTQQLDVGFGFADPANPLGSLRLVYREGELEFPAEELGLGVQSAIVVGIFEAFRELGGDIGTVLIEEPEMYLHPQAQRYFYGLLCDLADREECQVIYSTHSPVFADMDRFESIRLVRRPPGSTTQVSWIQKADDVEWLEQLRKAQKLVAFTPGRSEAFFASRVLLVEGPGDAVAVRLLAERLEINLDAEDLAVIECGSKNAIPFVARVCRRLRIPVVVLHDLDIYPEEGDEEQQAKQRQQNRQQAEANKKILEAVGDPAAVFTLDPSLEAVLGIGRRADDKPRRIVEALEGLESEEWPGPVREALAALTEGWWAGEKAGSPEAGGSDNGEPIP